MQDHTNPVIQQLLEDDSFRTWVLAPTDTENQYWEHWIQQHPQHAEHVATAMRFIQKMYLAHDEIGDEELSEAVQQISNTRDRQQARTLRLTRLTKWAAAVAGVILLAGGGFFLSQRTPETPYMAQKEKLESGQTITEITNNNASIQTIQLPDGSTVKLNPGSRISFPHQFTGTRREVNLSGEAFFSVIRNPEQPFLVYANNLVTKVLGTSFVIKAYDKDQQVQVIVRTGKVAVFANDTENEAKVTEKSLDGVIITPNQQVVYDRQVQNIKRSIVETPQPLIQETPLSFDHTPVATVFQTLEKVYGIPIQYDSDKLANCQISADMTKETLYQKLDLICKAIEASYQVVDNQIVVTSKSGC